MTRHRRLAALAACAVVALLVAWYAGTRFDPPAPVPPAGTVALGPEPGEPVAAYLARLPADLPPPGIVAPALVQFGAELSVADALAATAGTAVRTAVFHVPMARVQTALRFEPVEASVPQPVALGSARLRASAAAAADSHRLTGRQSAVAAAETAALDGEGCPCILAMVVAADRAGLDALASRAGVRAVQAAPPGTTDREIALSPLLPGQTERADPLPDDGSVPSR